jgi:exopolyphosphatase / guanosine-5'-triphosphate,3'-diphosphate pyrophosphatase
VKRAPEAAAQPRIGPDNSKNTTERLAALDIGTHAAKLLVVEARRGPSGIELQPLLRAGIVTRLGAGRSGGMGGGISAAAEGRARGAMAELVDRARALSARTWVAAGTGVLRRAPNGRAVARRLGAALGIEVPVLRPEIEAALSILGARAGAGAVPPLLGVDLGGGSTELIFLGVDSGRGLGFGVRSLELGCLQLAERYLSPGGRSSSRGVASLRRALARALPGPILRPPSGPAPSWLAIGGTATALAAMDLGLTEHDPERVHGHRLTGATIARLIAGLSAALEAPGRTAADGTGRPFHRQPVPVLLAGALLLGHLMAMHSVREVVTSTFGLRHGLVLGELGSRGRSRAGGERSDPRHSARLAIELARRPLPPIRSGRWENWEGERAKRVDPSVHPQ